MWQTLCIFIGHFIACNATNTPSRRQRFPSFVPSTCLLNVTLYGWKVQTRIEQALDVLVIKREKHLANANPLSMIKIL